ncbi:MAG: hypothetical protein AAFV19_02255 [Pseudomonadota bacterium]
MSANGSGSREPLGRILLREGYFWFGSIGLALTVVSNLNTLISLSSLITRLAVWWQAQIYWVWDVVFSLIAITLVDSTKATLSIAVFIVMIAISGWPRFANLVSLAHFERLGFVLMLMLFALITPAVLAEQSVIVAELQRLVQSGTVQPATPAGSSLARETFYAVFMVLVFGFLFVFAIVHGMRGFLRGIRQFRERSLVPLLGSVWIKRLYLVIRLVLFVLVAVVYGLISPWLIAHELGITQLLIAHYAIVGSLLLFDPSRLMRKLLRAYGAIAVLLLAGVIHENRSVISALIA